mgnify:CR=1 FL=1
MFCITAEGLTAAPTNPTAFPPASCAKELIAPTAAEEDNSGIFLSIVWFPFKLLAVERRIGPITPRERARSLLLSKSPIVLLYGSAIEFTVEYLLAKVFITEATPLARY